MNKRALVLEMNSSHITLLSEEGEFIRLSQRRLPQARYVGQNISMSQIKPRPKLGWVPLLAACIFLFLVVIPLVFPPPVMAWVSLDNSSSLEVLVDGKFNIREIRPLNNSAGEFLEEYQGGSLEFPILVDEFINWSLQNGDNSLLVTATDDIQTVTSCINNFSDKVQVVSMKVDAEVRDEAGKKGLSAGRAIFMAEASSWEAISPEKMKEGNPIETIDSAGVDLNSFVSGLESGNHAAKIKDLPAYNHGDENKTEGLDPSANSGKGRQQPPGQVKKSANFPQQPPGLAKKDADHPALRSISRSGHWGNNNNQETVTSNPEDMPEESQQFSQNDDKVENNKDKNKKYKANNGNGNSGNKGFGNNGKNGNQNNGYRKNNNGNKDRATKQIGITAFSGGKAKKEMPIKENNSFKGKRKSNNGNSKGHKKGRP